MNRYHLRAALFLAVAFIVAAASLPGQAQAATEISGSITQDTVWDTSGSPYTVTGNTTVFPALNYETHFHVFS